MRRFAAVLAPALSFALLAGCGVSVRKPDADEIRGLQQKEQSLVLLRMVTEVKGNLEPSFSKGGGIGIASIDTNIPPETMLALATPSVEAEAQGWIYFFAKPGTHYLHIERPDQRPAGRSGRRDHLFLSHRFNAYWFNVPSGGLAVNLGALRWSCTKEETFFGTFLDQCGQPAVLEDRKAAEALVGQITDGNPPVLHTPLRKTRQPVTALSEEDLFPMAVADAGSPILGRVPWISRGTHLATGGVEGMFDAMQAREGFLLYLLYLPFGILGGTISGVANAAHWEPCMDGLEQTVLDYDMSGSLQTALLRAFGDGNKGRSLFPAADFPENGGSPKTALLFDRLQLRIAECRDRGTFCVDLSVRVRLLETASGRVLYDSVLFHADDSVRLGRPFYETSVSPSRCRSMDNYCDRDGQKLFMAELARAMTAIASALASDLGLAGRK